MPDPGTVDTMAKPQTASPAGTSLAHSLVAEEVPAAAPIYKPASAERSQPIAPAPPPEFRDPALLLDKAPATMTVMVTHGTVRHDGNVYPPNSLIPGLPADLAKRLEAQGAARIVRRPA